MNKTISGFPPISVNKAWQGRRFKTKEYSSWRQQMGMLLGKCSKTKGWVDVELKFYLPSRQYKTAEVDNFLKGIMDVLVEKEIIEDDRFVKKVVVEKFLSNDYEIQIQVNSCVD